MLCGVIICLLSVILLGIDGRFVSPETYPTVRFILMARVKFNGFWCKQTEIERTEKIYIFCNENFTVIGVKIIDAVIIFTVFSTFFVPTLFYHFPMLRCVRNSVLVLIGNRQ